MTVTRAELRADINRELSDFAQPVKWSDATKNAEINAAIRDSWPWSYVPKEASVGTLASSTLQYEIPAAIQGEMADALPYAVEIEQGAGEPYMAWPEYQYVSDWTTLKHYIRFPYVPGTAGKSIRIRYRVRQAELNTDAATAINGLRQWIVYRASAKLCNSFAMHTPEVNARAYLESAKLYIALAEQTRRFERVLQPVTQMIIRR